MNIPRTPHRWSVTPRQARAIQERFAPLVITRGMRSAIRFVAGTDMAFTADGRTCIAAAVVWDVDGQEVIEERVARRPVAFPYVPGLLSFREAPAVLAALRKVQHPVDAIMCDGQGLAHPRRFGLACHVGLIANLPTVGCAKSRLVGEHAPVGPARGTSAELTCDGEVIGAVLRTRTDVKPVFVSVGHRISLSAAIDLVVECAVRYRLPEPTRLADRLVAAEKKRGNA